jgi:hypothetical protein
MLMNYFTDPNEVPLNGKIPRASSEKYWRGFDSRSMGHILQRRLGLGPDWDHFVRIRSLQWFIWYHMDGGQERYPRGIHNIELVDDCRG